MDYSLKFKEIRNFFKLTQIAFAEDIGVSRSVVSQIELKRFNPTIDLITVITTKFNIDLKYFFTETTNLKEFINGNLTLPKDGNLYGNLTRKKEVKILKSNSNVKNEIIGIPFYEKLIATAGNFTDVLANSTPTSYFNLPQIMDCTAVIPVHGSSMKGLIESGDFIAIKEVISRSEFDPSLPYLVITNEHRMIKYLRADPEDSQIIWADSTNLKPFKLEASNILFIYSIKCVIRLFG